MSDGYGDGYGCGDGCGYSTMVVVAGDSGVYVGYAEGGARALGADGRVELTRARHLRRYVVAGGVGDGSAGDLAVRGLDPSSPSIADVVPGVTVLVGVRRAFDVAPDAAASFGCE
jgi:hypothetical protein